MTEASKASDIELPMDLAQQRLTTVPVPLKPSAPKSSIMTLAESAEEIPAKPTSGTQQRLLVIPKSQVKALQMRVPAASKVIGPLITPAKPDGIPSHTSVTPQVPTSIIRNSHPMPQTLSGHLIHASSPYSHVPRGPAAVASITTGPKSVMATPIIRTTSSAATAPSNIRIPTAPSRAAPQQVQMAHVFSKGGPGSSAQQLGAIQPIEGAVWTSSIPTVAINKHISGGPFQMSEKVYLKPPAGSPSQQLASSAVASFNRSPPPRVLFNSPTLTMAKSQGLTLTASVQPGPRLLSVSNHVPAAMVVSQPTPLPSSTTASIPVAKVHPQPSNHPSMEPMETSNIFMPQPGTLVLSENRSVEGNVRIASLPRPAYNPGGGTYYYEPFQVNQLNVHQQYSAPNMRPVAPPTTVVTRIPPATGSSVLSTATSQSSDSTAYNSSPRPSILRKRNTNLDGVSAVKKNILSSFTTAPSQIAVEAARPATATPPTSSEVSSTTSSIKTEPPPPSAQAEHQGNTTLHSSAPGGATVSEASPRKKPRKQHLAANELIEAHSSEGEEPPDTKPNPPHNSTAQQQPPPPPPPPPPAKEISTNNSNNNVKEEEPSKKSSKHMSLLDGYVRNWKIRHNHFLNYSDVRVKEEKKKSLTEIANQKNIQQKINGWKILRLSAQMDDVKNLEDSVYSSLSMLLEFMENSPPAIKNKAITPEEERILNKINDLIKGNLQRSKLVQDQLAETRTQLLKVIDHKDPVNEILEKFMNKRTLKRKS